MSIRSVEILDYKMHRNADVEHSVSVQRPSIIESLPLILIADRPASAGQYGYIPMLLLSVDIRQMLLM